MSLYYAEKVNFENGSDENDFAIKVYGDSPGGWETTHYFYYGNPLFYVEEPPNEETGEVIIDSEHLRYGTDDEYFHVAFEAMMEDKFGEKICVELALTYADTQEEVELLDKKFVFEVK